MTGLPLPCHLLHFILVTDDVGLTTKSSSWIIGRESVSNNNEGEISQHSLPISSLHQPLIRIPISLFPSASPTLKSHSLVPATYPPRTQATQAPRSFVMKKITKLKAGTEQSTGSTSLGGNAGSNGSGGRKK